MSFVITTWHVLSICLMFMMVIQKFSDKYGEKVNCENFPLIVQSHFGVHCKKIRK